MAGGGEPGRLLVLHPHEKNVIDFLDDPLPDGPDRKGKVPLQRDWSLLRLERTQDEILGVMTGGERAFLNELLHRYEIDALLFSAGGNDLLGPDLAALSKPYRAGVSAADALVEKRLTRRLRQIEDCYRELIDMVLDEAPTSRFWSISYDLPVPSCEEARLLGGRSPGPWLRPAFAAKGYPAGSPLEREIPRLLLDGFCALRPPCVRSPDALPPRRHPRCRRHGMGGRDSPQRARSEGGRRAFRAGPAALCPGACAFPAVAALPPSPLWRNARRLSGR